MQTDETLEHAGHTITARDVPRGEFGVYRHYEVDGERFDSLEDAKAHCEPSPPVHKTPE